MSNRSLNGISGSRGRTLNGLVSTAIEITGEKPLIINDNTGDKNISVDISTLDTATLGLTNNLLIQQGSLLKKTTLTDIKTLIDTNTEYGGTTPIVLTGTTFSYDISSLDTATLGLTNNLFVQQGTALKKTTLTDIKTLIDTNTQYTARSPLLLGSSTLNEFSLSNLSGYGTAGQLIVSTSSSGTGSGTSLSYSNVCKLSDIKTTNANLLEENRFFQYTTGSDLITIGNNTDTITFFSKSATGSPYAINMPAVSSASTLLTDTTLTASGQILLSANNITLDPTGFIGATTFDDNDKILMLDADGTTFEKIPKESFIASLPSNDASIQNNFGTGVQTGTRELGILTQISNMKGSNINIIGTQIAFQIASSVLGYFETSNFNLNTGTLLRLGNNSVLTNNMSDVWTDCNIQTDKDINLYSVGQNFTASLNRIGFIAGASAELTAEIGYAGSAISVANGGVPNGANNGVIGSLFLNATGSSANISFCITPIATDITSKRNKMIIDVTNTHSFNPIILDGVETYLGTGTNKDLFLRVSGNNIFFCDASNRRHVLMGLGAINYASTTLYTAFNIINNASFSSDAAFYQDARMRLHSVTNSTSPVIELIIDAGLNSGTLRGSFIFVDSTGSLYFNTSSNNTKQEVVINGQNLRTTRNVYFTDIWGSGSYGVYFILGTDENATSGGYGWKMDIGGSGDLHFKYKEGDIRSITQISGYLNHVVTNSQMNFTGQHRTIPQEKELYDNVEDYIGMIVESTGKYNSIIIEEEDYDFELITKIPEEFDISTNTKISEEYIKKEIVKKKKQTITTTNEATINEAQPIVTLTKKSKSKRVYGVISSKEDGDDRIYQVGIFVSDLGKRNDNRLFINSLGEGGIKVCNQNGDIENGDLLCSSDIEGIAMKQTEEYVANFTIGKSTQDYKFIDSNERKLIGCVYYCG